MCCSHYAGDIIPNTAVVAELNDEVKNNNQKKGEID
jgi:hypothetical protein